MAVASPSRSTSTPKGTPRPKLSPEEKLVGSLIALLEAGTSPWRREWEAASGGHHVNLLSGRRYRGANPALLTLGMHLRGSALPYWCGFGEARVLGLFPRKGSKAVHVLRPRVHQRGDGRLAEAAPADVGGTVGSGSDRQDGAGAGSGAAGRSWVSYRPVAVFNVVDLEGQALEGLLRKRRQAEAVIRRPEPERMTAAEAVLGSWPVPVRHGGDRACYLPMQDRIQLPERSAFHSAAALYATWAHEAIHSTGHSSRLARDLSGGMGDGGDGGRACAREELLRESPRVLLQVLSDARKAADLICPDDPPAAES